jgi:hypothetical protein
MTNAKNLNTQINKYTNKQNFKNFFLYFQSFHRIQIERKKLNKVNCFLFVSQAIFIKYEIPLQTVMVILDNANIKKLPPHALSSIYSIQGHNLEAIA